MFKNVSVTQSPGLETAEAIKAFCEAVAAITKKHSSESSFSMSMQWCVDSMTDPSLSADIEKITRPLRDAFLGHDEFSEKIPWNYEVLFLARIVKGLDHGSQITIKTKIWEIKAWLELNDGSPLRTSVVFESGVLLSPTSMRSDKMIIKSLSQSFNEHGEVVATGDSGMSIQARYNDMDFRSSIIPLPEIAAKQITINLFFPKSMFSDIAVNPYVVIAQEATEAFSNRHGLYTSIFSKFQEMKFAWLCGFAYSTPSFLRNEEKLCIVSDWITALFSHDDAVDGLDVSQDEHAVSKLTIINNRLIAIVNTPLHRLDELSELAVSPREQAMAEVYTRLISHAHVIDDRDLTPFRETFEDYLRATEWECRNRESKTIPRFKEYQWRRRDTGAAYNAFAIGLLLIGCPRLMDHSVVHGLADHVCDSIGVVNDMYSYWKEARHLDVHENAVKLRVLEERLSVSQSFLACEKAHKQSVVGMQDSLSLLTGNLDKIVPREEVHSAEEGILFIQNWALANTLWSEGTGRYAIDGKSRFGR